VDLTASFAYGDHHSDLPFVALARELLLVSATANDIPETVA
jgi:phosphoserine phosphatase